MNFIKKAVSLMLVCVILMGFILIRDAEPAEAATTCYQKYTQVDIIENYNGITGMQGMAMDDTYIYSVKIATATEDNAFITRTNRATGATSYLTNGKTGTIYFTNLGHANDMEMVTVNGVKNLLVATGNSGSEALVRFTLSGTTLTQVGNYNVVYADNGNQTGASSAQVMRVNGTVLDLMIKKNKYLYTATLDTAKTSGQVVITHVFTMDVANMWLNGKKVDTTEWLHQGFEYRDGKIFVPISQYPDMSASAIVVCNVNGASGTIQNDPNLSFLIKTSYEVFEIESCEICPTDGRLYFNTNQSTSSSGNYDSVHYITDYVYDGSNGATESDVYRWETVDGKLKSVTTDGAVFNGLVQTRGSISGYAYTDGRFSMSRGVVLKHDEPWILEWKSSGSWGDGGLLLSKNTKSSSEGNRFIYRRKASTLIALGEYTGGTYYNYGLDLASYGVDGTAEHVFRMTNKIASDGSNMVYLSVDGRELGPMNNYYIAGASQGTKSNWLNGKDFTFSYIGTDSHPIDDCKLEYIQVWGKGLLDTVDEPDNFRWNSGMTAATGTNLTENTATCVGGTVSGTTYTDARFALDQKVVLRHDRPWSVEFKSEGAWSSLLLSSAEYSQVPDAPFLFRNNGNGMLAFGSYDGSQYNNYGIVLKNYGIDATVAHTYRLTNRIAADGTNMVYVYVDGEEIGPMNSYVIGGSNLQGTSDWISGKDFTFTRLGTVQHDITTTLNYLQIWENGIPAEHSANQYRWETKNDTLTNITNGFTANNANVLSGQISGGTYSGSYFRLDKPVVLLHDRTWSIQWQSEGDWTDAANGALLLSNSIDGKETNTNYLYRRNGSHIIAFGERLDGYHQNYGIKLSDYGIDGTTAHTYRLENRVNTDGSNMVYLFVDGKEIGAMNQYFKAGTAQNTTSNWVSGKDFTFSYLGNPDFPIGNCSIGYLQVNEGCTHSFSAWSGTNATCTADGVQTRSCTLCGITETQTAPATGHSYNSVVTKPTCTTPGYTTYTCTNCGDSYTGDNVAVGGHSYKTVVTQPTCETIGYTTYTCSVCGDSYVGNSVAALGHRYQTVVTAPTCTANGYTTYTCANCSDTLVGNTVPATGHSYVNGSCTACGAKDPNYVDIVVPTLTLNYPSLSFEDEILYNVYYTVNDTTSIVEMGLAIYAYRNANGTVANAVEVIPGYVNSGATYMVQSNGIPAKNLGDAVYFKVYAKLADGSYVYSDIAGYHAVAYANTVLNNASSSAKAKALVVAMLNYGAAAQEYFGYKTDSLMNAGLTAQQQALVQAYDSSMVQDVVKADSSKVGPFVMNGGYSNIFPTVSFEGAFSINFYFTPNKAVDAAPTLYYWDAETYNSAVVLSPWNATGVITMNQDGKNWGAAVEGIAAKAIDETIYVAGIYTSNGVAYPTSVIAYSLGNYCKTIAANGEAFGAATAVYGYYAKAYFA